jgi:hypothetical protein
MNIPVPTLPHYERSLPSGKMVKFRPFNVSEEMILLQAMEGEDSKQLQTATFQVIKNCVIEPADFEPETTPWFDIDALLLILRAFSVNSELEVNFTCNNEVDGEKCKANFVTKFDIENLIYHKPEGPVDNIVHLGEGIGVKMKWPSYTTMRDNMLVLDDTEQAVNLIAESVESVFDDSTVYPFSDKTREERLMWVKQLMPANLNKIIDFVNTAPTMHLQKKVKCPKCEFEHEVKYERLSDFFV